jgi:hypothetical protein
MRMEGRTRRYKYYTNASQCYAIMQCASSLFLTATAYIQRSSLMSFCDIENAWLASSLDSYWLPSRHTDCGQTCLRLEWTSAVSAEVSKFIWRFRSPGLWRCASPSYWRVVPCISKQDVCCVPPVHQYKQFRRPCVTDWRTHEYTNYAHMFVCL